MRRSQHPNALRWLHPPTIEIIDAVIKKHNISETRFEDFYGIYFGCIRQVRMGIRSMPVQHWHLFFDTPQSPDSRPASKSTPKQPNKRTKAKPNSKLAGLI
jgi:hypothetical protein